MALAVVCLLVAVAHDPGSGTAVNFQDAADTHGLVVGAHHPKPVPDPASVVDVLDAAHVVVLAVLLAVALAGTALLPVDLHEAQDRSVLRRRRVPRRGPPALA